VHLRFGGDGPMVEELEGPFGPAAAYACGVTRHW
jgi:hypothetical protein